MIGCDCGALKGLIEAAQGQGRFTLQNRIVETEYSDDEDEDVESQVKNFNEQVGLDYHNSTLLSAC